MILNPLCVLRKKRNIYFILDYYTQCLLEINKRCFSILKIFENNFILPNFSYIQSIKGLKTLSKKEFNEFIQYCLDNKLILSDDEYESYKNKRKNISDEFLQDISKFAQSKTIPIKVEIELTGKCNYTCLHCAVEKKNKSLTFKQVYNFLQKMKELGSCIINLTGGEILLYNDLEKILTFADKNGFCINLLSNASLFTAQNINTIFKHKCINTLQTSLYSLKPEVYDKIVKYKNCLPKVLQNLKLIKTMGINIDISFVLMKYNQDEINNIKQFCEINEYNFKPVPLIFACKNHNQSPLKLRPDKKYFEEIIVKNNLQNAYSPKTCNICNAGRDRLAVDYHGNIYPCSIFPKKIGTIHDNIQNIWENNTFLKMIRKLMIGDIPKCSNCPNSDYCELCIGVFYINNGNILVPDEYDCLMAKISKISSR